MSELVIASNTADLKAAETVRQHHAAMAGALQVRVEALIAAAAQLDIGAGETARRDLVDWCDRELVPHALAEEKAMYPAAHSTVEGRLLVEAMLGEHRVLVRLVRRVGETAGLLRAAASAAALGEVFASHLAKENELVLPLLAAAPDVSLAGLLAGIHELLGVEGQAPGEGEVDAGCGGHGCSCGEVDGPGLPELDVRSIPHPIRHATVLGALGSLQAGAGLELVAPHDPLPLLEQVNERWPGVFVVAYHERGPVAWRLSLVRTDV